VNARPHGAVLARLQFNGDVGRLKSRRGEYEFRANTGRHQLHR